MVAAAVVLPRNNIKGLAVKTLLAAALNRKGFLAHRQNPATLGWRHRAGLVRARSEGKQLGRPSIAHELADRIREARAAEASAA